MAYGPGVACDGAEGTEGRPAALADGASPGGADPTGAFVSRLSTTPIKGFALDHPEEVLLEAHGAVGDRDLLAVDDEGRSTSVTRTGAWVGLHATYDRGAGRLTIRDAEGREWADDVVLGEPVTIDMFGLREVGGHVVEGPWNAMLSERAGLTVRLVRTDVPGAASDVHPVSLLADASVDHLAERAGLEEVDPRRFRMLLGIGGVGPHAEDAWAGRRVRVGEAILEIGGPVPRCAAVTRHPDRGDRDVPIVRMIRDYRGMQETELGPGVNLGVYARVVRPGRVRVGDALELEA
jgi:uncharacterized protein YcbX